jgi:ATP-dependent DNA helicase RecG
MTPARLHELIAAGETPDVEFKGDSARPLSDADLVEAVVCLANRPGGEPRWLLIGVEDDGRVASARARHETGTDPTRLQALVADRTRPSGRTAYYRPVAARPAAQRRRKDCP